MTEKGGSPRGRIERVTKYIIRCGRCYSSKDDIYVTRSIAEYHFRKWGWSKTGAYGWICPDCKRILHEKAAQ